MISYFILGVLILFLLYIISQFRPAPTRQIADNLFSVRCMFVNFYALATPNGVALFDIGVNAALARRGLKKLGISPDAVTHIFLTHTDYDHVGGLSAFPDAEVYLSEREEQMIDGRTARRGPMRNKLPSPYHTVKDGESIVVGDRVVKLILTPGHTPGSSSYFIDERILITGDLLRISGKGTIKPFLWFINMDHRQDALSMEAIRSVTGGAEYILTGHTGVYHNET